MSKAIQRVDLRIPYEIYTELEKIAVQKNIPYAPKTKPNYDGSLKTDKEGNLIEPRVAVTPIILELLSESLKKTSKVIPFKTNKNYDENKKQDFIPLSLKKYSEELNKKLNSLSSEKKEIAISGIKKTSPFPELTKYLPSDLAGKIFVVTGLPAIGKTTFVLEWLHHFLMLDLNKNASCFVSYEMSLNDLISRNGFEVTDNNYVIETDEYFGIEKIEQAIKYLTEKYSKVMIGIDFLQLIPSYYSSDSEATRVSRLITKLKQLANKYNTCIVVVSDVGKVTSYNQAKGKSLSMDIVRDSYRIAYSADMLFYLGEIINLQANVGVKILKNRFGEKNVYFPLERKTNRNGFLELKSATITGRYRVEYDF